MRRAGYRVWSLSYDDVTSFVDPAHDQSYHLRVLDPGQLPFPKLRELVFAQHPGLGGMFEESPLELLGSYLAMPEAEGAFLGEARAFAAGMTNTRAAADEVLARTRQTFEALEGPGAGPSEPEQSFIVDWAPANSRRFGVYGFNTFDSRELVPTVAAELNDVGAHDDLYKKAWNSFWHLWDLMQFEPGFVAVSKAGLEGGAYTPLWYGASPGYGATAGAGAVVETGVPAGAGAAGTDAAAEFSGAWADLLTDDFRVGNSLSRETVAFMRGLAAKGVLPGDLEVGYETDDGDIAELAWPSRRVCYLTAADADFREAFEADDWTVMVEGEDNDAAVAALKEG